MILGPLMPPPQKIIHFERSPPEGDCDRRAIEVEGLRGPQSKESYGGGQKKEAAGIYRSRGPEEVPVERELRWKAEEGSSRNL